MYKIQHITGCFPKYSSFTSFNEAVLHSKVNIRLLFSHLLLWLKISQTCFLSGLRVEQWILLVCLFVCFGICLFWNLVGCCWGFWWKYFYFEMCFPFVSSRWYLIINTLPIFDSEKTKTLYSLVIGKAESHSTSRMFSFYRIGISLVMILDCLSNH